MSTKFVAVSTSPSVPANSNFIELSDTLDDLTISLEAPDEQSTNYTVKFRLYLAYQVIDEGDRLLSMEYLNGRAATPIGQIENSPYLRWFVKETLEVRENDPINHWCIVTPNEVIDVLSMDAPDVSITK